jgi:hypothetical protein
MSTLPAELLEEILQYFRPDMSPIIAEDAVWKHVNGIPNWWSPGGQSHLIMRSWGDREEFDADEDLNSRYKIILPWRL